MTEAGARSLAGHEEAIGGSERREHARGVRALERRVAQRAAQPRQDGRADEEAALAAGAPVQVLLPQVGGDVGVGPGDGRVLPPGARGAEREGSQVQPGGPALAAGVELVRGRLVELEAGGVQQRAGLAPGQRQVRRVEREELARGAPARHGQPGPAPGEDELRAGRQPLGDGRHQRPGLRRGELVHVVEDEHRRPLGGRQGPTEPGRGADRAARVEAQRAPERGRHVGQQHGGVVVAAVHRDPREGAGIAGRPLRQQRRLAVAGGRRDLDAAHQAGAEQPVHERGAPHEAAGRRGRRELALVELQPTRRGAQDRPDAGVRVATAAPSGVRRAFRRRACCGGHRPGIERPRIGGRRLRGGRPESRPGARLRASARPR